MQDHPLLSSEFERIKAGRKMPALDIKRYDISAPTEQEEGENADEAWKSALKNAEAQHGHHCVRYESCGTLISDDVHGYIV